MARRCMLHGAKRFSTGPDRDILPTKPSFLNTTHNTNHILSQIVKEVLDEMDVSFCGIWLLNKHEKLVSRIVFGVKHELYAMTHSKRFTRLLEFSIKRKKYIHIHDLKKIRDKKLKKALKEEGLTSLLTYPLFINQTAIGALVVARRKNEKVFDKYRIKIGNILAKSASRTVKNLCLYKKSVSIQDDKRIRHKKEYEKALAVIRKLRVITQSSQGLKKNVENVIKETSKFSTGDLIIVKQYDRRTKRFNTITFFPEYKSISGAQKRMDNLLNGEVAKRGGPLSIENLEFYAKEVLNKDLKLDYKSYLAFPIVDRRYMIGMVSIYWHKPRLLGELEFNAIETTCSLLSVFLKNADLINKVREGALNVIKTLAALTETKDEYTHGHSKKVMKYSIKICKKMRLSTRDTDIIKEAALLHDLGKVVVDNRILHKKAALTKEEWETIKKHPIIGAKIIAKTGFLTELVSIVEHHHERFAGGGYPNPKMKHYQIPLGARIIAVADTYDAMNSNRAYRKALEQKEIIRNLKQMAGAQLDPKITRLFIEEIV